ncbi:MAG: AAA family ATPase [Chloroflexota bacterium]|nr:AAA family ATPase [Chloroflexota bacterium]
MNVPVVAFFNNKGGVGKTSLVYHLAWMYADLGFSVLAADLDPQANLTSAFLDEDRLTQLWIDGQDQHTIYDFLHPLIRGVGDISEPVVEHVDELLSVLVGDLALSKFEDQLSEVWPKCMDSDERAFRVMSAFWRILAKAAEQEQADLILMDLGPNLGAINRAALISVDYVVVPLAPDLFSLQGLRNLGPTLRDWRKRWRERLARNPAEDLPLPQGRIEPVGYILLQHSVRLDRPVKAYERWIARIPGVYREEVLDEPTDDCPSVHDDPHCLALIKHYRSLMPMAQEVRKPIFHLKPADGAIGSHYKAVQQVHKDFRQLARKLAERIGLKNELGGSWPQK